MTQSQKIAIVTDPPYNAKGDGITDDTDAIQQAIDENEMVYLPAGTYLVTDGSALNLTAFAVPSGRSIRGAGPGVTIIKLADGGNAHIFNLENATDITISDMTIDGNRTTQILSVHAVRVLGSSRVWLQRLNILNPRHYGIGIDASALNSAEDIFIDSVRVEGSGGDSINQHNNVIGKKVQRIMMSNITVINPVTVDASGAALDVRGIVTLSNIHVVDVAAGRWAISLRNTYVSEAEIGARRSTLTNFYLEGAPGNGSMGLRIVAGEVGISNGFIQGFDYGAAVLGAVPGETFLPTARVGLSNVIATGSGKKGFFFGAAAKEISCVNCRAYENLNDGVEIQGDAVSWIGGGITDNAERGLVVSGIAEDPVIIGAKISGNAGGNLVSLAPRLQLLGIQGMRMENSGTAAIASGTTSTIVTHGLWFTPEAHQIQVTPTNSEATGFWVSDVNATTFTINTAVAPDTTATYTWRAAW
jgi:hypothetical protein